MAARRHRRYRAVGSLNISSKASSLAGRIDFAPPKAKHHGVDLSMHRGRQGGGAVAWNADGAVRARRARPPYGNEITMAGKDFIRQAMNKLAAEFCMAHSRRSRFKSANAPSQRTSGAWRSGTGADWAQPGHPGPLGSHLRRPAQKKPKLPPKLEQTRASFHLVIARNGWGRNSWLINLEASGGNSRRLRPRRIRPQSISR